MNERWVLNASPVILLGKLGRLDLVPALCAEWVIPRAVYEELARGPADPASQWIRSEALAHVKSPAAISQAVAAWDLGAGETEVISWALENPGWRAVLDDRAARMCASAFGVPVVGTLGVLLLAKRRGCIQEVGPLLEQLLQRGCRISPALIQQTRNLAGEKY